MPDTMKKVIACAVKEVGPRTLRFIGSTEEPDRDGDIIRVAGWELTNYRKNPVFLWAHHYHAPPIGRATRVVKNREAKALEFDIEFADAETYPFADTIFKLYKGGFLKATSVGFIPDPRKRERRVDEEDAERFIGWEFKRQELLELSGAPVPSNPEALVMAYGKGLIPPDHVEEMHNVGLLTDKDLEMMDVGADILDKAQDEVVAKEKETMEVARLNTDEDADYVIRLTEDQYETIVEALQSKGLQLETVCGDDDEQLDLDEWDEHKLALDDLTDRLEDAVERLEAVSLVVDERNPPPAPSPPQADDGGSPEVLSGIYDRILQLPEKVTE